MPAATSRKKPDPTPADPLASLSHIVNGEFALSLGTEHERQIRVFVESTAIEVTDAASYQRVGENLKELAAIRKRVVDWFKPMKTMANQLHKMICSRENAILGPLEQLDQKARGNLVAFAQAEERRRRAEEQRLAQEAQRQEQERLQREAEELERRGEKQLAEAVLEQAVSTPAPVIALQSSTPEIAGIAVKENWTWRPIGNDPVRALQLVPREFLCLDEKKLTAYAKAHKGSAKVPGIEFYDAGGVSVRA